MLSQVYGPDPIKKPFVTGSKSTLAAGILFKVTMLGELNVPTQLSWSALTILLPAMFLPVKPLFHVFVPCVPQLDQTCPGMMVTSPIDNSVNGPLILRLRSRVNSSRTLM